MNWAASNSRTEAFRVIYGEGRSSETQPSQYSSEGQVQCSVLWSSQASAQLCFTPAPVQPCSSDGPRGTWHVRDRTVQKGARAGVPGQQSRRTRSACGWQCCWTSWTSLALASPTPGLATSS